MPIMWKKRIKSLDVFGYPAHLNFDTKSPYGGNPTHNTLLGGMLSVVYVVLALVFAL